MTRHRLLCHIITTTLFASALTCGCSPTQPATIAITVTANPNTISGRVCTGCGAGSTDRESVTDLTISETAGAAGAVTSVAMILRDGSNTVIAQGEFDAGGVAQFTGGSTRLAARGSLTVRGIGVHYAATQAGRTGTLTYTVRVTDDRGNVATKDVVATVTM